MTRCIIVCAMGMKTGALVAVIAGTLALEGMALAKPAPTFLNGIVQRVRIDDFSGSGFFVSNDGYLLTAMHNFLEVMNELKVGAWDPLVIAFDVAEGFRAPQPAIPFLKLQLPRLRPDDSAVKADVVLLGRGMTTVFPRGKDGFDEAFNTPEEAALATSKYRMFSEDYILLKIDLGTRKVPCLRLAKDAPEVGEKLTAVGYPVGWAVKELPPTFEDAVRVSSHSAVAQPDTPVEVKTDLEFMDTIMDPERVHVTQALVVTGVSGGPMINSRREVVGINRTAFTVDISPENAEQPAWTGITSIVRADLIRRHITERLGGQAKKVLACSTKL